MGYYDGIGGGSEASSWQVASETGTPAILVVDTRGMALSAAALVAGFDRLRMPSHLAGIVLNHCSASLHSLLAPMIEVETGLPVFGYVPRMEQAEFSSRHLGLNPEDEQSIKQRVALLAEELTHTIDIDALLRTAATAPPLSETWHWPQKIITKLPRIAVARDAAFHFCYPENIETLQALGADIVYFSPLQDETLPQGTQGIYLVGGYPELHAAALSSNIAMLHTLRESIHAGMPTLAECGGFMYLHTALESQGNHDYPQVGTFPGRAFATDRLQRFGYATLHAKAESGLVPQGYHWPVHEFHYWDSDNPGDACIATKPSSTRSWPCMVATDSLLAGFPHHYFPACLEIASRFVLCAGDWTNPS